jgi:hypothetical protein
MSKVTAVAGPVARAHLLAPNIRTTPTKTAMTATTTPPRAIASTNIVSTISA